MREKRNLTDHNKGIKRTVTGYHGGDSWFSKNRI